MQKSDTDKTTIVFGLSSIWTGGAQQQLARQLPHYKAHGYDVHVISLLPNTEVSEMVDTISRYATVHQLSCNGLFDIGGYRALHKLLKEINPDIVVTSLFFANTVFRVVNFSLKYPLIAREHNTYAYRSLTQRFIDRFLASFTDKIVAVSEEVVDFMSAFERIPREKFLVIQNGIDIEEVDLKKQSLDRTAIRNSLGIGEDVLMFLSVGRLVVQKNHDVIIKGFKHFYQTHKKSALVLVGDSIILDDLQQLAKNQGVESAVHFAGHQDDVHPYYHAADVFVSASNFEGMSNTQLEALAHGLPLLTTKTGGTSKILADGENGFIIDTPTTEAVANAMEKISKANLPKLSRASRSKAYDFDILKTIRAYEALFKDVVSKSIHA